MNKKNYIAVLMGLCLVLCLCAYWLWEKDSNVTNTNDVETKNVEQQIPADTGVKKLSVDNDVLQDKILDILGDESKNYSAYFCLVDDKQTPLIINNQPRRSASMIKVFIMAYAMEMAKEDKISLDNVITLKSSDKVGGAGIIAGWKNGTEISIRDLVKLMITESDNTATNILIRYFGMENINTYISLNGYNETMLRREMMDFAAVSAGKENYTSVNDLGMFFSRLANHSCVGQDYDDLMIDILLQQTDTEVFPAVVPNVKIAHKTGELDNLYDDGGIVFKEGTPFVIVIMNDDISRGKAVVQMKRIFSLCYDYNAH